MDDVLIVGAGPTGLMLANQLARHGVRPLIIDRHAGESISFQACSWYSTYRIHHRRASRLRVGRCFLLGDAAHVHSPVGAQGMNTGLQDAYNLAWKLALVVSGRAQDGVLDSYQGERLPVAKQLLSTTDRMFSIVVADGPITGLLRTQVMPRMIALAMKNERIQRKAFGAVSQTGIHYRGSALSHDLKPPAGSAPPWRRQVSVAASQVLRAIVVLDLKLVTWDTRESGVGNPHA